MLKRLIPIFFLLTCTTSCGDANLYMDYHVFNDRWPATEKAVYEIDGVNQQAVNLMIYIRNDHRYPFANLFLIASLKAGDTVLTKDTLEYAMADAQGAWLGGGFLEVKESKLWWKENFEIPQGKPLTAEVQHAVRFNGAEDGIEGLEGIVGVGLALEATAK